MDRGLVVEGDVFGALDLLAARRASVDLVVTDPPWGRGDLVVDGVAVAADDPRGEDLWAKFTQQWLTRLRPLLAPTATVAVLISPEMKDILLGLMKDTLDPPAASAFVWEREYSVDGVRGHDEPWLVVAGNDNPRLAGVDRWSAEECGTALVGAAGDGRYRTRGIVELEEIIGRHRVFGAKPVALFDKIIDLCDSEGDGAVLDPFAGSGPLALAAAKRGRPWVAIERPAEASVLVEVLTRAGNEFDRVMTESR